MKFLDFTTLLVVGVVGWIAIAMGTGWIDWRYVALAGGVGILVLLLFLALLCLGGMPRQEDNYK